jgi:hypothetical protein
MPTQRLNNSVILAAIQGFELQKAQIDQNISELRSLLRDGSRPVAASPEATPRKRRKFSAAAIQRMKEAQRKRWAKARGQSEAAAPSPAEAPKPKRRLSAAGRRNIIAATKARFERLRAEKAVQAKPATAKKGTPAKKAAVRAPSAKAAKRGTPAREAPAKKTAPAAVLGSQAAD